MKLLTITAVATKLGVSRVCVHQWIKEGRIKAQPCCPTCGSAAVLIHPRDAKRPKPLKRGPKVTPQP